MHQELGGQVTFLGVDVIDTEEAGIEMVAATGVTYRNGRDPRGEILRRSAAPPCPAPCSSTPTARWLRRHNGEMTAEELTAALEEDGLLA